jgi:hypothetical protein
MIETILTSLAVGTIWFYLIIAIASVIFIACIEHDHYGTPTVLSILLAILYWKAFVTLSLPTIAIIVGGYALAGIIWSVYRWYRHVQQVAFTYREKYGLTLTPSQKSGLKSEIRVSDHKSRITAWIAYWPWSLLWNITGDFFSMLYDAMVNAYQHIADHALNKFTVAEPALEKKKEVVTDANPSWRNR